MRIRSDRRVNRLLLLTTVLAIGSIAFGVVVAAGPTVLSSMLWVFASSLVLGFSCFSVIQARDRNGSYDRLLEIARDARRFGLTPVGHGFERAPTPFETPKEPEPQESRTRWMGTDNVQDVLTGAGDHRGLAHISGTDG